MFNRWSVGEITGDPDLFLLGTGKIKDFTAPLKMHILQGDHSERKPQVDWGRVGNAILHWGPRCTSHCGSRPNSGNETDLADYED